MDSGFGFKGFVSKGFEGLGASGGFTGFGGLGAFGFTG